MKSLLLWRKTARWPSRDILMDALRHFSISMIGKNSLDHMTITFYEFRSVEELHFDYYKELNYDGIKPDPYYYQPYVNARNWSLIWNSAILGGRTYLRRNLCTGSERSHGSVRSVDAQRTHSHGMATHPSCRSCCRSSKSITVIFGSTFASQRLQNKPMSQSN